MSNLIEYCDRLSEDLEGYTSTELKSIYNTEAHGAPWNQFDRVMRRIDRAGLDIFRDQAYIVRKEDKKSGDVDLEFRSSIQALRMRAEQSGKYAGQRGPWWTADGKEWVDVWIPDEPPVAAMVEVLRTDFEEPMRGVARFDEYAARYRSGDLMAMWAEMQAHMIAKCAEALALKRAFPQSLGGLVTRAEMHRDDEAANQRATRDDQPSSNAQALNEALTDGQEPAEESAVAPDGEDGGDDARARSPQQPSPDDGPEHGSAEDEETSSEEGGDEEPEPTPEESEAVSGAETSEEPETTNGTGGPDSAQPADSVPPEQVDCEYCGARAGESCRSDSGDDVEYHHKARKERAKAASGDVEAFAQQARKKIRAWQDSDRDVQDLVASISVEIADWDEDDWETVVSAMEEEWGDAREECDLRRTPEELRE